MKMLKVNRVYQGDCLDVMEEILKGSIQLIYIDPPFGIDHQDKKFGMIPWVKNTQEKNRVDEILPIIPENTATRNYLRWLYNRIAMMRDLLTEDGNIYIHCDWRMNGYIRLMLDGIFGKDNLRNEIIWRYRRWPTKSRLFQRMHDTILWYTKSITQDYPWTQLYEELSESSKRQWKGKKRVDVTSERGTRYSETLEEESPGVSMSDVWEISQITAPYSEYRGFPTQKPEKLLERIVKASSNEGDLVADFFCGSGTTAVVAKRLGRKWIVCDINKKAIEITRNRIANTGRNLFQIS